MAVPADSRVGSLLYRSMDEESMVTSILPQSFPFGFLATFVFLMFFSTWFSHLSLGCPIDWSLLNFNANVFHAICVVPILSAWPEPCSLCLLTVFWVLLIWHSLYSSLVCIISYSVSILLWFEVGSQAMLCGDYQQAANWLSGPCHCIQISCSCAHWALSVLL